MVQEAKSPPRYWQSATPIWRFWFPYGLTFIQCLLAANFASAARFVAYFPLPADYPATQNATESSLPPKHPGIPAELATQWQAYCDTWQQHHASPSDAAIRKRLGIAADIDQVTVSSGQATAVAMRLPITEMQRYDSEHFALLTDVAADRATAVVRDLERYYFVWTQLFFPLWKDRATWDQSVKQVRRQAVIKHRVVLFANAARYQDVLRSEGNVVGQSTGFYSDLKRVTFFHDSDGDSPATRHHELTHQLMSEATPAKPQLRPGERRDFWLVEGIACYMESTIFAKDQATVGGWQASRLQFARHRVLSSGDLLPLSSMIGEGRLAVQQRDDLSRWYSFASAYTHRMIDEGDGAGLIELQHRLTALYQMRVSPFAIRDSAHVSDDPIAIYLQLDDAQLTAVTIDCLQDLCLAHTELTSDGLAKIVPQTSLKWLELSFLKIGVEDIQRLCPQSTSLEQLNLEGTTIDDSIANWMAKAGRLRELDLSSTRIGDAVITAIPMTAPIETLWLTGTLVSDASIEMIGALKTLKRVDLQRTQVTESGIAQLRLLRPDLQINPLEVASR